MSGNPLLPTHVAVIIDGNRRWARARGLHPWQGHIYGKKRVEEVSRAAIDLGIEYVTFWGGSYNNLTKRTPQEIKVLDSRMYRDLARKALKDKQIHRKQVRVRFIGEWPKLLSAETKKAMREVEKATRDYSNQNLTYLIGYNGDREMLAAINSILKAKPKKATAEVLKSHLWTRGLPPVDLMIRTGEENPGSPHLSTGFMMWDIKDALLHFTKKMWPDFTKTDFEKVIRQYSKRERRFGR